MTVETDCGFDWTVVDFDGTEKAKMTFRVLDLEGFNIRWRPIVVGGDMIPEFERMSDLNEWYRRQFPKSP